MDKEKCRSELGVAAWRCGLQGQTGTELVDRLSCRTLQKVALWEEAWFSGVVNWTRNLYLIACVRAAPHMGIWPTSCVGGEKEMNPSITCKISIHIHHFPGWWMCEMWQHSCLESPHSAILVLALESNQVCWLVSHWQGEVRFLVIQGLGEAWEWCLKWLL